MIPNLDQLLLVCGIAIGGVAFIMWLLLKIPSDSQNKPEDDTLDPD